MRGVGPGTVLGGRYTVRRRLEQLHRTERWSADDTTLGRSVSVLCIASDDHRTPAMLDAARRAASVTHLVFVRILDVGSDDDVAYVVEEDLGEARTLADLVADGGVPGDEVRRITGEVASALESASHRGMHHLDLKPDDVLRTPDGDVRLRGLETAAVRAGQDGAQSDDAARRDAVGVVALAYAGLTGLWPLGAGGAGLGAAPRVPGGVAAPSEIAAGVPRDLDAICRLTLNDDQGPTSPGDYARQVAPWPTRQVVGRPVTSVAAEAPAAPASAPPASPAATAAGAVVVGAAAVASGTGRGPDGRGAGAPGLEPARSAGVAEVAAPPGEPSTTRSSEAAAVLTGGAGVAAAAAGAAALGRTAAADPVSAGTASTGSATSGATAVSPRVGEESLAGRPVPHESTHVLPLEEDAPDWLRGEDEPAWAVGYDDGRDARARAGAGSDPADRVEPAPGRASNRAEAAGAGAAFAGALGSVGERVGGLARRAVDKVAELSPDSTTAPGSGGLEAPAPLVPADPLTKDESKLALAIVAGFLILALVIGIWGVSRIGSNTSLGLDGPPAPSTRTTTVAPSTSSSGAPTATPSEGASAAPEPLAILKVEAYDPEGDGEENNKLTPKVYDGDPDTGWFSENYRSETFGGLKKGLGVIVDLGPNKKPQGVELVLPETEDVEVYVGPDNRLEGATKIGEQADARGTVQFAVPADVSGQYVVVWFTKLSTDDNGKRRAWLNEVVVTG
ncbi:MAG TPA: hypothetical protein VFN34_03445 [Ornithinibacter sp.]|nr:hypothetical protein [Ornithinibacter sp.]